MNNTSLPSMELQGPTSESVAKITSSLSSLVGWCAAFGVVAIAVTIGNSLAVAVLTRKKMLRRRTSFFIISLAVADLIVGTFSVPSHIYQLWQLHYGTLEQTPALKVIKSMDVFSGLASTFTLTIIALERVYAICFPLRHRTSSRRFYRALVCVVWVLAGLLSSLYFFHKYNLIEHQVFFLFQEVTFFVSMFIMFAAYIAIWLQVRASGKAKSTLAMLSLEPFESANGKRFYAVPRRSGRSQTRPNVENEKRLAGTVFIVTTVFVFAWIPFQIINLIIFVACKTFPCSAQPSVNVIYFCKLLQYSNSFWNPVIYSLRLQDFRATLAKLLMRKRSLELAGP